MLLCNEFGRGLGHLAKLLPVGHRLAELGFEPVLAVRDTDVVGRLPRPWPHRVLEVPAPPPVAAAPGPRPVSTNMADILAGAGLANPETLRQMALAWESILVRERPALLVTDFSPFLHVAALGRIPLVALGTGFTLPPPSRDRFPNFRAAERESDDGHARVTAALAEVQAALGRALPATLPALLAGTVHFVCALPELDPYRAFRDDPAIGPLEPPPSPLAAEPSSASLLVYLAGDVPACPAIVTGLLGSGLPGQLYVRGDGRPPWSTLAPGGALLLLPKPVEMDAALHAASLVVHHGGLNTAQRTALAGRPQLILSCYQEQALTGRALERHGTAVLLRSAEQTAARVRAEVEEMAADSARAARARVMGASLRARHQRGALPEVLDACLRLATPAAR